MKRTERNYIESEQINAKQLAEDLSESNVMMPEGEEGDWHTDICRGIVMAYFLVMALIYPFYAPGGYTLIGDVKYEVFRNISLTTIAVMAVVILAAILCRRALAGKVLSAYVCHGLVCLRVFYCGDAVVPWLCL